MVTPTRKMIETGTKPTSIEICVDQMRRERMSRPSWSLPSRYVESVNLEPIQIGSIFAFGVSCFSGSLSQPSCVMKGTVTARSMNRMTMIIPTTAARLRRRRYQASCQSDRCLRTRTLSSAARSAVVCFPGVVVTVATLFGDLDARVEHAVDEVDREVRDGDEERVEQVHAHDHRIVTGEDAAQEL